MATDQKPLIRKRSIILIAIFALLFGAIAQLPAAHVVGWLNQAGQIPPTVKLADISGTVWRGRAGRANVSGMALKNLSWDAKPWRLLLLDPVWVVHADSANGFIDANVHPRPDGSLRLEALRANLPLTDIPLPRLTPIDGELVLNIDRARLTANSLTELDGETALLNSALTGRNPMPLGSLVVAWETTDAGLSGTISDEGAVVAVSGTVSLDQASNYALDARLTARADTADEVANALNLFARKTADGSWALQYKGSLQNLLPRR